MVSAQSALLIDVAEILSFHLPGEIMIVSISFVK